MALNRDELRRNYLSSTCFQDSQLNHNLIQTFSDISEDDRTFEYPIIGKIEQRLEQCNRQPIQMQIGTETASRPSRRSKKESNTYPGIKTANTKLRKGMIYVVGNQAGDADSVVSALAAAHWQNSKRAASTASDPVYHHLVSFPRQDFKLRGDLIELFRMADWEFEESDKTTPKNLLFLDQVKEVKEIVLTDANVIGSHLKVFGDVAVKGIIDHHKDEGKFKDVAVRILDEAAGSTCSLITNEIFRDAEESSLCPQSLCVLLYGVILLDTRNFSEGRHSQADLKAMEYLSKRIPESFVHNREQVYKKLMDARNDVSHLSVADLLRLDYKEVMEHEERLGFSTLFETVSRVMDPAKKVEESMAEMMDNNKLSALFAITSVEADSEKRGFLLCARDSKLANGVIEGFQAPATKVFSPEFLSLPLVSSQKIHERGFGLDPVQASAPKVPRTSYSFSAWTVHGTITRKTMLPAVIELIARVKRL